MIRLNDFLLNCFLLIYSILYGGARTIEKYESIGQIISCKDTSFWESREFLAKSQVF